MLVQDSTIASIHGAFANGSLNCRALVEACLARIDALDQRGPKLNAVITVNPRAAEIAEKLDGAWRNAREKCGPLHGIPILVKDNFDTEDLPTTASASALKGAQPRRDAFAVGKLRSAGAIILAKTALTELAMGGTTAGSLHGQTRNPYDLTRTPGGSSGGTAAGIAAGYGVFGIGSDTYQSIRSPASACALAGLRGTRGLVSRAGLIPFSFTQDEAGPMARCVSDLARALDVMAGFDRTDPITADCAGRIPRTYTAFLDAEALAGKRVGVLRQVFGTATEHAEVNGVMASSIGTLVDAGAFVRDVEIPNLDVLTANLALGDYELKAGLDRYFAASGGPIRSFDDFVAAGVYDPLLREQLRAAQSRSTGDPGYREILARREDLRRVLTRVFARNRFDVLVYPHQRRLVAKIGEEQLERNGVLANATGFPALAVHAGFSTPDAHAPLGVPIGLEFLAPPWNEGSLLGMAFAFEQARKARRPPLI